MFRKDGDIYVDRVYGSDTSGTGSKLAPFYSLSKAADSAPMNGIIVVGPGEYQEALGLNTKNLTWVADGFVLCNGVNQTATAFPSGSFKNIYGFRFINFRGNKFGIVQNTTLRGGVFDCSFVHTNIGISAQPFYDNLDNSRPRFQNCVFRHVVFPTGGVYSVGTWVNCNFDICAGGLGGTLTGCSILNCNFYGCAELSVPVSRARNSSPPVNGEFDYCNIDGEVGAKDVSAFGIPIEPLELDEWKQYHPWALGSSYNLPLEQAFTDVLPSRTDITAYRNIYTLRPTIEVNDIDPQTNQPYNPPQMITIPNPLIAGGKRMVRIGALSTGRSLSAQFLWANRASSSNISLTPGGELALNNGAVSGTLETNTFALGTTAPIAFLVAAAQFVYRPNGTALEFVDQSNDPAPSSILNQKTIYDIQVAFGPSAAQVGAFTSFELLAPVLVDANNNGRAHPNYDETTARMPSMPFVRLRLSLKRV